MMFSTFLNLFDFEFSLHSLDGVRLFFKKFLPLKMQNICINHYKNYWSFLITFFYSFKRKKERKNVCFFSRRAQYNIFFWGLVNSFCYLMEKEHIHIFCTSEILNTTHLTPFFDNTIYYPFSILYWPTQI